MLACLKLLSWLLIFCLIPMAHTSLLLSKLPKPLYNQYEDQNTSGISEHNNHEKGSENCHITSCCPDRHMTAMRQGEWGGVEGRKSLFLKKKKSVTSTQASSYSQSLSRCLLRRPKVYDGFKLFWQLISDSTNQVSWICHVFVNHGLLGGGLPLPAWSRVPHWKHLCVCA